MRKSILAATFVPCVVALAACSSSASNSASANPSSSAGSSASAGGAGNTSGSGGANSDLTSAQMLAKFQAALATATAVHFKGTIVQSGQSATVDIQINKAGSAKGTLAAGGTTIPFVSDGKLGYIQYTSSLEAAAKIDPTSPTGQQILNKWAASNTSLGGSWDSSIAPLVDWSSIAQVTGSSSDTYAYQGTATLDGQQVVQYKDTTPSIGTPASTLSFPATGPMLPIQVSASGSGAVSFTWNQPTTITAPPAGDLITIK